MLSGMEYSRHFFIHLFYLLFVNTCHSKMETSPMANDIHRRFRDFASEAICVVLEMADGISIYVRTMILEQVFSI